MEASFFNSISFRRGMIITSCMIAVVLGVIGVSGAREFSAKHADVSVSAAWYLLAIVPPIFIATGTFTLSTRWRSHLYP